MYSIRSFFLLCILSMNSFASTCSWVNDDIKVFGWTYEMMMRTQNYDFINPPSGAMPAWFGSKAWNKYKIIVDYPKQLQQIKKNMGYSSVGLENSPVLLQKSSTRWIIKLPMILHYRGSNGSTQDKKDLKITLEKQEGDLCLKIESVELYTDKSTESGI